MKTTDDLRVLYDECFRADFESGTLTWRVRPTHHFADAATSIRWNRRFSGKLAGGPHKEGYIAITLTLMGCRQVVLAHRVLWFMAHGEFPTTVDHINGVRTDNRAVNMRAASYSDNNANRPALSAERLKGATLDKRTGRYVAQISRDGRNKFLGRFNTEAEAHAAYISAVQHLHGEFAKW